MVNKCINNVLALLYPPTCRICGAPGANHADICDSCRDSLPANTSHCACCAIPIPLAKGQSRICGRCQHRPPPFHHVEAPFLYRPPIDRLIGELKYGHRLGTARLLGSLLAAHIDQHHSGPVPQLLVPVPAHRLRLRERGFNPAAEITRILSSTLNLRWRANMLRRTKWSGAQQQLTRKQRLRNVRNSFRCNPVAGVNHVALVDDVVTTGATATAATRALHRSGVHTVEVWAVARTP